jgi:hypothetical protein
MQPNASQLARLVQSNTKADSHVEKRFSHALSGNFSASRGGFFAHCKQNTEFTPTRLCFCLLQQFSASARAHSYCCEGYTSCIATLRPLTRNIRYIVSGKTRLTHARTGFSTRPLPWTASLSTTSVSITTLTTLIVLQRTNLTANIDGNASTPRDGTTPIDRGQASTPNAITQGRTPPSAGYDDPFVGSTYVGYGIAAPAQQIMAERPPLQDRSRLPLPATTSAAPTAGQHLSLIQRAREALVHRCPGLHRTKDLEPEINSIC